MASDDGLRFLLLPSEFTTEDLNSWLSFAEQRDEIRMLTGLPVVWDEIARLVLNAQVASLIVADVLVAALLAVAYRRWWETLVSLVHITLTIATLLAFIALSGMQAQPAHGRGVKHRARGGHRLRHPLHRRYQPRAPRRRRLRATGDRPRGPTDRRQRVGHRDRPERAGSVATEDPPQLSQIMWVAMVTAGVTSLLVVPALLPRAGVRESTEAPGLRSVRDVATLSP